MGSPVNLLINGKGTFLEYGNNGGVTTPTKVFNVASGVRSGSDDKKSSNLNLLFMYNLLQLVKVLCRYRFRIISPGFTLCPISVSIDNHRLTMIASDGSPFRPVEVESFVLHPGERL